MATPSCPVVWHRWRGHERLHGRQPVEVTHLAYKGTLQAEALALVAAKMRSALMIEGNLPEDELAALAGDGQDVLLALARRLTEEHDGDGESRRPSAGMPP